MIALINDMPVAHDEAGAPMVCHGCGHSHAAAPYPGEPSGERPCLFCTRNPDPVSRASALAHIRAGMAPGLAFTARYDNGPTAKEPADQYIATDRVGRDVAPGSFIIT